MFKNILFISFCLCVFGCKPIEPIENRQSDEVTVIEPKCLPSQSTCHLEMDFADISIGFSQQLPLPVMNQSGDEHILAEREFVVVSTFAIDEGIKIDAVTAYMEGKDMFMGKVPLLFSLKESSPKNSSQPIEGGEQKVNNIVSYSAESLLANCTEELMVWRIWFSVTYFRQGLTEQQNQRFFIDFTAKRS